MLLALNAGDERTALRLFRHVAVHFPVCLGSLMARAANFSTPYPLHQPVRLVPGRAAASALHPSLPRPLLHPIRFRVLLVGKYLHLTGTFHDACCHPSHAGFQP